VVTEHIDFAEKALGQLDSNCYRTLRVAQDQACEPRRLREIRPDVALIDHGVTTQEGLPLFQLIRNVVPDCEVILISAAEQAAEAARLAKVWEVFDYILADSLGDVNRIPLLVERATTRCMPNLAELRGQAKMDQRRILESLSELRVILKSKFEGPVVELLHRHKMKDSPFAAQEDSPEQLATEAYQHSVVDLICGRLKRLEALVKVTSQDDDRTVSSELASKQILVVDDEAISAELAKFILERNGFDVVSVDSAASANRFLEYSVPALILMDVHLGDANGLRLVRALRDRPTCRNLPVIVITADSMPETVRTAVSVDVQGFLRKPYDAALLVAKVKNVLAEASVRKLAPAGAR
jgi:CheY-like chemotaxis protein